MHSSHQHLDSIFHRPPLPAFSSLFAPVSTPHSGLSIFASTSLAPAQQIHQSGLPSASCVVQRWRRGEVCEVCHEVIESSGGGNGEKEVGKKGEGLRWFCAKGKEETSCYEGWKELYRDEGREGVRLVEEALSRNRKGRAKKSTSSSRAASGTATPRADEQVEQEPNMDSLQRGLREILLRASERDAVNEAQEEESALTEDFVERQLESAHQNYLLLASQPNPPILATSRSSTPTTQRLRSSSPAETLSTSRTRNESPRRILRKLEDQAVLKEDDDEDLLRFLLDGLVKKVSLAQITSSINSGTSSYTLQPESWQSLLSLVPSLPYFSNSSNRTTFSPLATLHSHLRLYHFLLLSLRPCPQLLESCTPATIFAIISRDSTNSFGSWGGEADPLSSHVSIGDHGGQGELHGYSLLPSSSYFNHSCEPNLSKSRKGVVWTFAIKDGLKKEVVQGDELCISYLGVDGEFMEREERQRKLKISWSFDCGCAKCEREKPL